MSSSDHSWYPPSLSGQSICSNVVCISGSMQTVDVNSLLRSHWGSVLTPSYHLHQGQVVMTLDPFALAEYGDFNKFADVKIRRLVVSVVRQEYEQLQTLPRQLSQVEARLALLAERKGYANAWVQQRLFYANQGAIDTKDFLTLANVYRLMGDLDDMRRCVQRAKEVSNNSVVGHIEIALFQRWCLLDEDDAYQTYYKIESWRVHRQEQILLLAKAQVALFGNWSAADHLLTKANQANWGWSVGKACASLSSQGEAFGWRSVLGRALSRLSDSIKEDASYDLQMRDYQSILMVAKQVKDMPLVNKMMRRIEEIANGEMAKIVGLLRPFGLSKVDLTLTDKSVDEICEGIEAYREIVIEQVAWQHEVDKQIVRLQSIAAEKDLDRPRGWLTGNQVQTFQAQVNTEVAYHQEVHDLKSRAQRVSLPPMKWRRPYHKQEIDQRAREIGIFEEQLAQMQQLRTRASHIGWSIEHQGIVTKQDVEHWTSRVSEQEQYHQHVQVLRLKATEYDGVLTEKSFPLQASDLESLAIELEEIRCRQVIALELEKVKALGWDIEFPSAPYTVAIVEKYRQMVSEQEVWHSRMIGLIEEAGSFGWEIPPTTPPYTLQEVEQFAASVSTQSQRVKQCHNRWGLRYPSFPIEEIDLQDFRQSVIQQVYLALEVARLDLEHGGGNKPPKPPFSRQTVNRYREKLHRQVRNRRWKRWSILITTLLMVYLFGAQWYQSVQLTKQAQALGWDIEVPIFGQAELAEQIPLQQKLKPRVEQTLSRAESIQLYVFVGDIPFSPQKVQELESLLDEQEALLPRVEDLIERAIALNWDWKPSAMPYDRDQVSAWEGVMSEQEALLPRVQTLVAGGKDIGWDIEVGTMPYVEKQITQLENTLLVQQELAPLVLALIVDAKQIGWDIDVGTFPYQKAEIERLTAEVAESVLLAPKIARLEKRLRIQFGFPYVEAMLKVSPKILWKKERLSQIDWSNLDVESWLEIRSLLNVQLVPAGQFTMGCTSEQTDCSNDETPTHQVTISKDFYMMESEVTQALYQRVMGENPSYFKGSHRPVGNVSWYDAVKLANKLSEMEGLEQCYSINGETVRWSVRWSNPECKGWRLPTEAEWEYSARGGQSYKYAGSDNVDEVAWYHGNSGNETHDVCGKNRNGYGLCDMSGNVWEWVWDGYSTYRSSPTVDPLGPDSGSSRVLRGGSCSYTQFDRVSIRSYSRPSGTSSFVGFRLCRLSP